MVLWIYLGGWICFVIGICQGSEYAGDTQGSECVSMLLNIILICLNMPGTIMLKQNLKYLYMLSSIYRDEGVFRILPNI